MALAAEKGTDFKKLYQKKKQKSAMKMSRERALAVQRSEDQSEEDSTDGDKEDDDEETEEVEGNSEEEQRVSSSIPATMQQRMLIYLVQCPPC